jgi:hypothetical protein
MNSIQIVLKPEQRRTLSEIAAQENKSISEIAESMLDEAISRKKEADNRKQFGKIEALNRIRKHRAEILAKRKPHPLNADIAAILNEIRDERDADIVDNFTSRCY